MTDWFDSIVASLKTAIETVFEQKSNKVTSISSSSTDTEYPSAKCVFDAINNNINVADLYEITSDKGTASASTMNKLYIEVDNNKREVYYTEENNGSYSWHKLDTDILDNLSISWNDITSKPSIPSKTSDLTNDGDGTNAFLTQHQDISGKEDTSNKVTSISSSSTDTQYPSAKCVYDAIGDADVNIQVIEEGTTITNDGIYLIVPNNLIASITGNTIKIADTSTANWLVFKNNSTQGVIDWGDGTTTSIDTSTDTKITHNYTDSLTTHNITISDVTILGKNCFKGCIGLTSITVPKGVTSIGETCFRKCSSLTSINLPNTITSIGEGCFEDCSGLTSIVIPNSVVSIGDYCFLECTSLTSVTISDGVTSIGEGCFKYCSGLTSISIPSSVTSIGSFAFDNNYLIDCQLYWTGNNILSYQSNWKIDYNSNAIITIPNGETSNYVAKGYPSAKLQERSA